MVCCGKHRARLGSTLPAGLAPGLARLPAAAPTRPAAAVVFEYGGATGLTAMGTVTRRLYRFDRSRARVEVDPRDAPGIAAVPNLRRVR